MSTKVCVELDCGGDSGSPVKTFVQTVGDGSSTTLTVPHNLGSSDVLYSLRNLATGELDAFDVAVNGSNPNALVLTFAVAPAPGSVRVVVLAV